MGWWSTDFCERLAERGFFVIRYDNRDTGRSTKLRQHRVDQGATSSAPRSARASAPYTIGDLADDAIGLLDHLGIERVHVVGVSMGGMIVQTLAIAHRERAMSMTSIMSTTGNRTRRLAATRGSSRRCSARPAAPATPTSSGRCIRSAEALGSPAYPGDRGASLARAYETYDRGWSASGVARHMLAVLAQPDRTKDLAKLDLPVTVIHGLERSAGAPVRRTRHGQARSRGAEHLEIAGHGPRPARAALRHVHRRDRQDGCAGD